MSQSTKICLVITQAEWGGAQRYVYDLACALHHKGFVVTVGAGQGKVQLLDKLKDVGVITHQFRHVTRSINPFEELYACIELWRYFRKNKFDVVHLNSSKMGVIGALAATLAGIPNIVFTAHGFHFNEKMFFLKKFFSIVVTWLGFLFTDHVIAVSEYDRQSALRLRIISPQKIQTIYNGVAISPHHLLTKEQARQYLSDRLGYNISPQAYVIGTIANFYVNKGLRYLIDAALHVSREIPETLFVIIGDGRGRKELERYIAHYNLQDRVLLVGFIEQAERYIRAYDVYVSASLKEGLPYTLIEARAAGIPIVATAVGGVPEIVDDASGLLVPPENSRALSDKIVDVLEQRFVLSTNHTNTFSVGKMVAQTCAVYDIL